MKHGFKEFLREKAKMKDPESVSELHLKEQANKLLRKEAKERKLARKRNQKAKRANR